MTLPTIPTQQPQVDHSKSTGPFQFAEDIHDAMKDPRYSKDKAYEDRIDARLDQTAPEVFTTSRNAKRDEVVEAVQAEQASHAESLNAAVASLDWSTVTPILGADEYIRLIQDPRYHSPYGDAYRAWLDERIKITPQEFLGVQTPRGDRQTMRHQMGTE